MSKEITITNCGPIHDFQIRFDHGPGVYQATGRSGSGKSTLLAGAKSVLKGKGKFPASVTDGERKGYFEGLGVRVTLSRAGGRRSGECEIESIEGRFDVSDLIQPGYKDPAANDLKRIKAIIDLTGATPDLARFEHLLPPGTTFADCIEPETASAAELIEMAARLKRDFEKHARTWEGKVDNHEREAVAKRTLIEGVDLEAEADAATLNAAYEAAVKRKADLEAQDKAAAESIEAAKEAAKRLEELKASPNRIDIEEARQRYGVAKANLADAQLDREKAAEEVAELEAQLAAAKERHQNAIHKEQLAEKEAEEAGKLVDRVAEYDQLLEELEATAKVAAARIPADELMAAAQQVDAAREAVERGAEIRKAREIEKEAERQAEAARQARKTAAAWRDAAAGVEAVLSEVVAEMAPAGLQVKFDDGKPRLWVDYPGRGLVPFEELSEGEVCKVALDVAIPACPPEGILVIEQRVWQDLQPANRLAVHRQCVERGVVLLTAQVDDGDLRVEYLGNN